MPSDDNHTFAGQLQLTRRGVLASLAGAITTAGVAGTVAGEPTTWPQQGHEAIPGPIELSRRSTGVETASEHCLPTAFEEAWQSPELATGVNSVLVRTDNEDDPVYASGINPATPEGGRIYALDPDTGAVLDGWPVETDGVPFIFPQDTGLLVYGDVGSGFGGGEVLLRGLDPTTGETVWEVSLPPTTFSLGVNYDVDQDLVIATTDGPVVTAVDPTDGTVQWEQRFANGQQVLYGIRDGESLYVPTTEVDPVSGETTANLWAVDTGSGVTDRERWSVSKDGVAITAVPAIGEGVVVAGFGNQDNMADPETELAAFDAATGAEQWSDSRSDDLFWSGVFTIVDATLYATGGVNSEEIGSEGVLARLDPDSGSLDWELDAGGFVTGLHVGAETAYAATLEGDVFGVNDDPGSYEFGQQVWERTLAGGDNEIRNGGLFGRCDTLYTGTTETPGTVYALDGSDGTTLDTFSVDAGIVSGLFPARGSFWVQGSPEPTDGIDPTAAENRTYRLDDGASGPPVPEGAVTFAAATVDLGVGQDGGTDLVVEGAENGVGSYDLVVEVEDTGVATIDDVVPTADPESTTITVQDDGSQADVAVEMGDNAYDSGDVAVFSLSLTGEAAGSTSVSARDATVTGADGAEYDISTTGDVDVAVSEDNAAPTAEAGADQTVEAGTTVTLDGSGSSDPDGDSLSYSWTQTTGPAVSFTDGETATPEFTAPEVDSQTDLGFELTVDDGKATDTDTTTVTVTDRGPGEGPPPVSGEEPPTDPDGDELYEDIDGNGDFDIFDIQALFNNLDNPAVTDNPKYFNFNGDDETTVDIFDVQALFNELQQEDNAAAAIEDVDPNALDGDAFESLFDSL